MKGPKKLSKWVLMPSKIISEILVEREILPGTKKYVEDTKTLRIAKGRVAELVIQKK